MGVHLASFVVGGAPARWEALGFRVAGTAIAFGNGAIELDPDADGPVALRVSGAADLPADLGGVAIFPGERIAAVDHPNGCFELDHVVIMTPSIADTSSAIEDVLGLPQKRIRETPTVRQAFHRFDDRGCIVELVEPAERGDVERAFLWGLVLNTSDLDALVASAGDLVGEPRAAVQPGRRIATVRRAAGLGCAVAFMSASG